MGGDLPPVPPQHIDVGKQLQQAFPDADIRFSTKEDPKVRDHRLWMEKFYGISGMVVVVGLSGLVLFQLDWPNRPDLIE